MDIVWPYKCVDKVKSEYLIIAPREREFYRARFSLLEFLPRADACYPILQT